MLQEYDTVVLTRPLPDASVPLWSLGVVLIVYTDPTPGYEVEFVDGAGNSIAVVTTDDAHLQKRESSTQA